MFLNVGSRGTCQFDDQALHVWVEHFLELALLAYMRAVLELEANPDADADVWDHTDPPHSHHPLFNKFRLDVLNVCTY